MRYSTLTNDAKDKYVNDVLERGSYFRHVQLWPLAETFDYEGWLDNFIGPDEKYIAARMLSFFMYFSSKMIDRMLYDAIGKETARIALHEKNRSEDFYKTEIYYSYLPGEDANSAVNSGQEYVKIVRDKLHVPTKRVILLEALIEKCLRNDPCRHFVFCDDMIGSGKQCVEALKERRRELGMSLYDYAHEFHKSISLVTLVANASGVEYVREELPDLHVSPLYTLGSEYNLFDPSCLCWDDDKELYERGVDLICSKSKLLGIPDNGDVVSVRGYENQGWALGFNHGIPDATPAIFFYSEKRWKPLMWRSYEGRDE